MIFSSFFETLNEQFVLKSLTMNLFFEERAGFFFLFKCEFLLMKIFGIFISITVYVIFFKRKEGFFDEGFFERVFWWEIGGAKFWGWVCQIWSFNKAFFVFWNECKISFYFFHFQPNVSQKTSTLSSKIRISKNIRKRVLDLKFFEMSISKISFKYK